MPLLIWLIFVSLYALFSATDIGQCSSFSPFLGSDFCYYHFCRTITRTGIGHPKERGGCMGSWGLLAPMAGFKRLWIGAHKHNLLFGKAVGNSDHQILMKVPQEGRSSKKLMALSSLLRSLMSLDHLGTYPWSHLCLKERTAGHRILVPLLDAKVENPCLFWMTTGSTWTSCDLKLKTRFFGSGNVLFFNNVLMAFVLGHVGSLYSHTALKTMGISLLCPFERGLERETLEPHNRSSICVSF